MFDKKVAIVGGLDVPEEDLEPYDYIIRTNNHWLRTGGRINALFHCGAINPDPLLVLDEVKDWPAFHFIAYPSWASGAKRIRDWHGTMFSRTNRPAVMEFDENGEHPLSFWYGNLYRKLRLYWNQGTPLTGFSAAAYALSRPIRSLHLTGMNLYVDTIKDRGYGHNLYGHAKLLLEWLQYDPRLTVDEKLLKAAKEVSRRQ